MSTPRSSLSAPALPSPRPIKRKSFKRLLIEAGLTLGTVLGIFAGVIAAFIAIIIGVIQILCFISGYPIYAADWHASDLNRHEPYTNQVTLGQMMAQAGIPITEPLPVSLGRYDLVSQTQLAVVTLNGVGYPLAANLSSIREVAGATSATLTIDNQVIVQRQFGYWSCTPTSLWFWDQEHPKCTQAPAKYTPESIVLGSHGDVEHPTLYGELSDGIPATAPASVDTFLELGNYSITVPPGTLHRSR